MDNRFGRYTTPTHTFTVPLDTSKITLLSIAYEQRGALVVEKRLEDAVMGEQTISVRLTEQETARFAARTPVHIQLRVGMGSSRLNSGVITANVDDVLREGELDGV